MDLTVFLFDSLMRLKRPISTGIVKWVHDERKHTLSAEILTKYAAKPGEFLGFRCVDGRFRLFCIDYADEDDSTGTATITATDAAVDELTGTIITRAESENIAADAQVADIAAQAGWTIGINEAGSGTAAEKGGVMSAWDALGEAEAVHNLYAAPHYAFNGTAITGKVIDILAKRPVYRGRFVQTGNDAEGVAITRSRRPRPKVYPVGADGLTIADVVWSTAQGDPVDKPAGQTWIGVPEAVGKYLGRGQKLDCSDVTNDEELIRRGWEAAQKETKPDITATAIISDMEMVAGQTWKSIRLWDLVRVRPKHGEDVLEQVIGIERNYIHPEQTKITLGKEPESSARQIKGLMTSAAATAARVGGVGRGLAAAQMLLEDTNVRLYELDGYTRTELSHVYIQLSAQEAAIVLKASREDLAETDRRLSEAMIRIDAAETEILLKASLTEVAGLEEDIREAFIRINGAESEIELKADKIELRGYVTANELSAEIAAIQKFFSGSSTIAKAVITNLNALSMTFDGLACRWSYIEIPTSGSIPSLTGYNVRLGDGSTAVIYAHSGSSRSITLNRTGHTFMTPT